MRAAAALVAGILFALGLALAGMTRPEKVVGFLDFGGAWDPSLAFVMVGAIGTYGLLRRLVLRRPAPLWEPAFHLPTPAPTFEPRLVVGSAIFGVGWGLAGYCPGPGLVALGSGALPAIVFVATFVIGSLVELLPHRTPTDASGAALPFEAADG